MKDHEEKAMDDLEKKIQKLLIDFELETGLEVESVEVDTRLYANCRTQVILR